MEKYARISLPEYWMGRDRSHPPSMEWRSNADALLMRVNSLLQTLKFPSPVYVSSGYRPEPLNTAAGGSRYSAHIQAMAVDLADPQRTLTNAILGWDKGAESLLRQSGLWMEDPSATPSWVHLDIRTRANGRIFKP